VSRLPLLGLLAFAPLCGCRSTVLEESSRAVALEQDARAWRAATPQDVPGLYSSIEIEGPAAAVLREVHYWFGSEGRFSGAALFTTPALRYQVLEGSWRLEGDTLVLGEDVAPARLEATDDLLRLSGEEGTVVLRRRAGA